ncbi:MAG TPA: hypothetical protein VMT18_11420 [Planctomycetota bacterium]|nr:hypothetical protein [Planctomycetota bacterium]
MRALTIRLRFAAFALACAPLSGCLWYSGQTWPGPMEIPKGELPPGDSLEHAPGPEEVSVLRHSDPVRVRPAGALTGYPLAFFRKRARLSAGGSLVIAPGGRAEMLWPSGSSVLLYGQAIAWVGSPTRGDPIVSFQELRSVRFDLMPGDRVELLGGAVLAGDSGPYMVDRHSNEVLRVRNQSDGVVSIAFRDETFDLDPGQSIRLPLLSTGGSPESLDTSFEKIVGPGFSVEARGPLRVEGGPGGVVATALDDPPGERKLRGLGVVVRLDPDSRAVFRGLSGLPVDAGDTAVLSNSQNASPEVAPATEPEVPSDSDDPQPRS